MDAEADEAIIEKQKPSPWGNMSATSAQFWLTIVLVGESDGVASSHL